MKTDVDGSAGTTSEPRSPLSRERVLRAAIELADAGGIESLSMRKLGQALGVEAMSLYNHVRDKEDVLDGIVDLVLADVVTPSPGRDWTTSMRDTVLAARTILLRHLWAPKVIESRTNPGPSMLRHVEVVLGILREGGFSIDLTHHAIHLLGSRIFGFTQDPWDQSGATAPKPEVAALLGRELSLRYPRVTEMATSVSHDGGLGGCDDDVEFAFGLDLILEGLERLRLAAATGPN